MGPSGFLANHCGGDGKMTRSELQVRLENLEELFDEIIALLDDPDIGEGELRHQLRELLEEDDDDE
jgi:hypothetical protein